MPLRTLNIGDKLGLARGSAAVCMPVYGAYDYFSQCLLSLLTHTPPDIPILICDDATPDDRLQELVEAALAPPGRNRALYYLRQPNNVGFVENVNSALEATAPADVVIVNSDCIVSKGWFDGLRMAAYSEERVATATALTNAGTILSVPNRNQSVQQIPHGWTLDRLARAVCESALSLRPDIPTCIGHCVYVRRTALELVGAFDSVFSPGYAEEVDFSQRCIIHGLRHVAADDVFVFHGYEGSFGSSENSRAGRAKNHAVIQHRYPYYDDWIQEISRDWNSPLSRSLMAATSAARPLTVTIDGRCLTRSVTGTQLVTIDVLHALAVHTEFELRVLVPHDLSHEVSSFLAANSQIAVIHPEELEDGIEPTDVVHRPYQVSSTGDLRLLPQLGRRIVITQLDTIAYRNPAYFQSFKQWQNYRRLNAAGLAAANQVVFISRHGADDARRLDLVPEERINVVYPAVDRLPRSDVVPRVPPGLVLRQDRPILVCLGTDFLHKNRLFAIRLLEALLDQKKFDGLLVLAGPQVAQGSSRGEEAAYLVARPELAQHVLEIGEVDEAGKRWLIENAVAVVYPTTYEGFGLTPFEAARSGVPCLFAPHTSLLEVLPDDAALLVPWNPYESAKRIAPVLRAGPDRDAFVKAIRESGARFTTERMALDLQEVYSKVLPAPASARIAMELDRVQELAELAEAERQRLGARVNEIFEDPLNRGLVGPSAILPPELRRAVLAVATRPMLRKAVAALYTTGYVLRHRRRRHPELMP